MSSRLDGFWNQYDSPKKATDQLLKPNLDKRNVSLISQFLRVKQILFFFSLYIITKQTC